jgi:Protein of unknown function (DUF2516)
VPRAFEIENQILLLILIVLLAIKAFALVDALVRKPALFVAADKQTKWLWLILLVLAVGAQLISRNPIGILNFAGTVAALVYLVDVRPAVRALPSR